MPAMGQKKEAAAPAAEKPSKRSKKGEDDRGLRFGTEVAYGDVYDAGGGDDSEFVSSLPTEEEERKLFGDDSVRAKEQMEDLDEGRVSNHPSTMASAAKSGGNVSVAIVNGKS
jgi:hypothetical protein